MNIKCKLLFNKERFLSLIDEATEMFLESEQEQIRNTLIDLEEEEYDLYLEDCISYYLLCYDLTKVVVI